LTAEGDAQRGKRKGKSKSGTTFGKNLEEEKNR